MQEKLMLMFLVGIMQNRTKRRLGMGFKDFEFLAVHWRLPGLEHRVVKLLLEYGFMHEISHSYFLTKKGVAYVRSFDQLQLKKIVRAIYEEQEECPAMLERELGISKFSSSLKVFKYGFRFIDENKLAKPADENLAQLKKRSFLVQKKFPALFSEDLEQLRRTILRKDIFKLKESEVSPWYLSSFLSTIYNLEICLPNLHAGQILSDIPIYYDLAERLGIVDLFMLNLGRIQTHVASKIFLKKDNLLIFPFKDEELIRFLKIAEMLDIAEPMQAELTYFISAFKYSLKNNYTAALQILETDAPDWTIYLEQ